MRPIFFRVASEVRVDGGGEAIEIPDARHLLRTQRRTCDADALAVQVHSCVAQRGKHQEHKQQLVEGVAQAPAPVSLSLSMQPR